MVSLYEFLHIILKELLYHLVIRSPSLASQQQFLVLLLHPQQILLEILESQCHFVMRDF